MKFLKNIFIPHEENNHHPHFWKKGSVCFILFVAILIEAFIQLDARVLVRKDNFLASILPSVLVSMTNEYRLEANTGVLTVNPLLEEAAKLKAEDMANRGYFAHNTPDGKLPWYWLELVGYKYEKAGENLAVNFFDSRDVAVAWMNSPSHRENLLKDSYTEIGIAMSEGKYKNKNSVFVVQFFGKPKVDNEQNVLVEKEGPAEAISVNSESVATTTASIEDKTEVLGASTEIGFFDKVFASPVNLGSKLLTVIGLIVFIAFLLIVSSKTSLLKHKKIVFFAILLLGVIGTFVYLNAHLFRTSITIATETSL